MTKSEAIKRAGSQKALAEILGVSRQAVAKWRDDKIPPMRLFYLKSKKRSWFKGQEC